MPPKPAKRMPKISPLMLVPPLIFATFVALVFWGMNRNDPDALPSALLGQNAPAILAHQLDDYPTFDASVFQDGEIKLVNFWASWCAPCRAEHANLMQLSEDIPIYGVNKQDRAVAAAKFLNELGNPFTAIATDINGRQSIDWGVYGLPETFLLDGDGKILLRFVGAITQRRMARVLKPAIAAARIGN